MRRTCGVLCAALALTAAAALPAAAAERVAIDAPGASADPVAGGVLRLTLNRGLQHSMERAGVKIGTVGAGAAMDAKRRPALISINVAGGETDPSGGKGVIVTAGGGIRLRGRGRSLGIRRITLNTDPTRPRIRAVIGGRSLTLATVRRVDQISAGFDTILRAHGLELTKGSASAIERGLRTDGLFRAGRRLGSASSRTQPSTVRFDNGGGTISFATGFSEKLRSLVVEAGTRGSPAPPGVPFISFLIDEGTVALDLSRADFTADARIYFRQGRAPVVRTIEFAGLQIDLIGRALSTSAWVQPASSLGEQLGLSLALATPPEVLYMMNGAVSASAVATIDATLAALLNERFATPVGRPATFRAGESLGPVSLQASRE